MAIQSDTIALLQRSSAELAARSGRSLCLCMCGVSTEEWGGGLRFSEVTCAGWFIGWLGSFFWWKLLHWMFPGIKWLPNTKVGQVGWLWEVESSIDPLHKMWLVLFLWLLNSAYGGFGKIIVYSLDWCMFSQILGNSCSILEIWFSVGKRITLKATLKQMI